MTWRATGRLRNASPFMGVVGLIVVVMMFLVVYPIGRMLARVFWRDGLRFEVVRDTVEANGFGRAVVQTAVTVAIAVSIAVVIGSLLAWINERTDAGFGSLSSLLPTIPLMVPPIAGTVGWVILCSRRTGLLNVWSGDLLSKVGIHPPRDGYINILSWPGMIFLYVLYLVPYVYLLVAAAMRNISPSLEEAARINGAGAMRTFVRITLPAVRPALAGGALLAVVIGFAMYSVPIIVGASSNIEVLSVRIVRLATGEFPPKTGQAIVLGLMVLSVVAGAWWVQRRLIRGGRFGVLGGKETQASRVATGAWRWPLRGVVLLYVAMSSVLPALALVLVSLQNFWNPRIDWGSLTLDRWRELISGGLGRDALWNSVRLGVVGATLGLVVASLVAFFARRFGKLGGVATGVLKAPGAISHIVLGLAFLVAFSGSPFHLQNTIPLLLIAYLVVYMPQASISAETAIAQVGRDLEEAAAVGGVPAGRSFGRITLPLMVPGLAAGWAVLFVAIAGDLTVSQFLASIDTPVVGATIAERYRSGSFPQVAAIGVAMTIVNCFVVFTALLTAKRLQLRRGRVRRARRGKPPAGIGSDTLTSRDVAGTAAR